MLLKTGSDRGKPASRTTRRDGGRMARWTRWPGETRYLQEGEMPAVEQEEAQRPGGAQRGQVARTDRLKCVATNCNYVGGLDWGDGRRYCNPHRLKSIEGVDFWDYMPTRPAIHNRIRAGGHRSAMCPKLPE